MNFEIASFNTSHFEKLHQLWQESAAYDRCDRAILHEKLFGDAEINASQRLACFESKDPVGFVQGVVRELPDGRRGYVKLIAVARSHQRQGIGARLLAKIEASLEGSGVEVVRVAEAAPNYLTPGIDQRNTGVARFFSEFGYQEIGEAVNQTVPLDQPFDTAEDERRLLSNGIEIMRARPAHRDGIVDLLSKHWPTWIAEVDRAFSNEPPTLYLALTAATAPGKPPPRVVGFSAFDANNVGSGWFGPMGSDPDFRGHGVGAVLLKRCLADLREQGHETATIPWVGPTGFYEQVVGAVESRRFVRMEKRLVDRKAVG